MSLLTFHYILEMCWKKNLKNRSHIVVTVSKIKKAQIIKPLCQLLLRRCPADEKDTSICKVRRLLEGGVSIIFSLCLCGVYWSK